MFRLFLIERSHSALEVENTAEERKNKLPSQKLRNRRSYERSNIEHKHLTLMNEQDILVVRDVSEKGFSTEVSETGFKRLLIGDVYKCRIRYISEVYNLTARVRWKAKKFIGFELISPNKETQNFFSRLAEPLKVGLSLVASNIPNRYENTEKYVGINDHELLITESPDGGIIFWRLQFQGKVISFSVETGIKTGKTKINKTKSSVEYLTDARPKKDLIIYAKDVFMSFQHDQKEKILQHLMEL